MSTYQEMRHCHSSHGYHRATLSLRVLIFKVQAVLLLLVKLSLCQIPEQTPLSFVWFARPGSNVEEIAATKTVVFSFASLKPANPSETLSSYFADQQPGFTLGLKVRKVLGSNAVLTT